MRPSGPLGSAAPMVLQGPGRQPGLLQLVLAVANGGQVWASLSALCCVCRTHVWSPQRNSRENVLETHEWKSRKNSSGNHKGTRKQTPNLPYKLRKDSIQHRLASTPDEYSICTWLAYQEMSKWTRVPTYELPSPPPPIYIKSPGGGKWPYYPYTL
jgi:hypothetical protein